MLDYNDQITAYLSENFYPSVPDIANFRRTSDDLLSFLFCTFPKNCISDYDLDEILIELGYTRHTWIEEREAIEESKKHITVTIKKILVTGWCLMSRFDLTDEVRHIPKPDIRE